MKRGGAVQSRGDSVDYKALSAQSSRIAAAQEQSKLIKYFHGHKKSHNSICIPLDGS